ncbi:MAG: hypothetical protein H0U74_14190 [Bradymonadaceae bacterium]|nr:hypothetical protein [Lujinxingiaceae bacterium]
MASIARQLAVLATFSSIALFAIACSPNDPSSAEPAPDTTGEFDVSEATRDTTTIVPWPDVTIELPGPLTYHKDIAPIVAVQCATCHYPGGAGPGVLDNYADLKANIVLALAHIDAGSMPPWSPDPQCRNYKWERLISEKEKAWLHRWVDEGMLEGELGDAPAPPERVDRGEPSRIARPSAAYTPDGSYSDEYRCFLLDATFDEDTFMVGTNVNPDNDSLVHHANIYLVSAYDLPKVERFESDSEGAGYPCFGDPGFASITVIGAWVPGSVPIFMPDDAAVLIPRGSRLVMQTHFNTMHTTPAPVRPEFHIYTQPSAPSLRIRGIPYANMSIVIPAGEAHSEHVELFKNRSNKPWRALGVAPHLHTLAKQVKLDVVRADSADTCLLDIPDWDFNWQQEYRFRDDEWVDIMPGDSVRLTCVFDNSPENQPFVDGVRKEPKEVRWGGRTEDEMCMAFLVVAEIYVARDPSSELCDGFKTCRFDCDDHYSVGCIFNCAAEEMDCGQCLLLGAQRCASTYCPVELRASLPCLLNCAQGALAGGSVDECLIETCPDEREALETCMRPRIEGGYCNDNVSNCNVEF